jgi:hypothetical protein
MSSAGRAANLSGCVARPKAREIGLIGFAAQIRRSSPTGSYVMETAEHREPCESRGSCTVLGARGVEIPPRDSSVNLQQCGEAFADFIKQFDWNYASHFDVPFLPGDTARLIHQNDARNSVPVWNGNFKRVTSRPACNWTQDTKTRSHIV